MAEYLIKDTTLTNIADAIREKSGIITPLFPESMPTYIRSIQTSSSDTTDVPDDIITEAERVASAMLPKIKANAVTFLAMSDTHEMSDNDYSDATVVAQYRRANKNAGQAAKLISDKVSLDFFAHLGDFAWGNDSTSISDGVSAITAVRNYIYDVVSSNESFLTLGNHDSLKYSYEANADCLDYNVLSGLIGTYRYHDLTDKKVRVICLNTADTNGTTGCPDSDRMSGEQLQWFAESLDLSVKTDAADWGIIILSHHPLDWGSIKYAANFLAAYLEGSSYSVTHNGVTVSYDFNGKNMAKIIAQFHGHVHGFRVDYINDLRTGSPIPTTVKRIAIPNACFARNNEYGNNDYTESNGIEFGEETTYNKSDNSTGKNTAFCLVSIDLDEQVIYADCFGAGYDRVVSYGSTDVVVYLVTTNLVNATSSNVSATILEGSSYATTITADDGYMIDSVTVTMGGTDVTDTVVSGNNISISNVTGDIVITATTKSSVSYDVTNLVLTSEEQSSTAVYNGIGYKNGAYASESGDGTDASCVVTGWIPYTWSPDNVIYVRGASVTTASHVRFYGYSTKTTVVDGAYATGTLLGDFFTVEEIETNYYKLTPLQTLTAVQYIRISLIGTGENLIITVNEPITASDGTDSGDSGTDEPVTYTNLVPTSVADDGETIFNVDNTPGYMDGTYASGAHYGTDADCVCTGFIWLDSSVRNIYVKGATWDTTNEHCRLYVYSTLGSASGMAQSVKATETKDSVRIETLGTNYYKFTLLDPDAFTERWYCMSLVGTGENLIITHDEPIE